jgi:hypothetical protein
MGEAHVEHERDVSESQVYVFAPVAFNVIDCPLQIAESKPASTGGKGSMRVVWKAVSEQPAELVANTNKLYSPGVKKE